MNNTSNLLRLSPELLQEVREFYAGYNDYWKAHGKTPPKLRPPMPTTSNAKLGKDEVMVILQDQAPGLFQLADPSSGWVWLSDGPVPNDPDVYAYLKWMGFSFSLKRKQWYHACGK